MTGICKRCGFGKHGSTRYCASCRRAINEYSRRRYALTLTRSRASKRDYARTKQALRLCGRCGRRKPPGCCATLCPPCALVKAAQERRRRAAGRVPPSRVRPPGSRARAAYLEWHAAHRASLRALGLCTRCKAPLGAGRENRWDCQACGDARAAKQRNRRRRPS